MRQPAHIRHALSLATIDRRILFVRGHKVMLSSVLRSTRAIRVNVAIMRAFVRLRGIQAEHRELSRRLEEMEKRHDTQFRGVFDAIRGLMETPEEPRRERIGFRN